MLSLIKCLQNIQFVIYYFIYFVSKTTSEQAFHNFLSYYSIINYPFYYSELKQKQREIISSIKSFQLLNLITKSTITKSH